MGACDFTVYARRGECHTGEWEEKRISGTLYKTAKMGDWPDAQTAFEHYAENDRYENGHSYSGGIGMKSSCRRLAVVDKIEEADPIIQKALWEDDSWVSDKWEPDAAYIEIREGPVQFIFLGTSPS